MFETVMPFFLCSINSIASGIYVQKFLPCKYGRKLGLFLWMGMYFLFQILVLEQFDGTYLWTAPVKVVMDIVFVFLLQILLYQKDLSKQCFVAVSFVAGNSIIRYIVIALFDGFSKVWWQYLLVLLEKNIIQTEQDARFWNDTTDTVYLLMISALIFILLVGYLSIMEKQFTRKEYHLRAHENIFLILPSLTTLCIAVTLRMMFLSVEDGIQTTVYEKVPMTMFWVPFVCLLLLGVNISSAVLVQKLIQLGEEERKRVMLENQTMQMQREIEEIQDIYADMRGLRHDLGNHLESIAAVIRKTDGDNRKELDGYLGKMEEAVGRLDFAYRTGNPMTDVILHQKKQEAERQQIIFQADFTYPKKQQIDVYDIGVVLNNALENAIEASSRLKEKKSIRLRSYEKGNLFFIEIENDFSGALVFDKKTGLPISRKADGKLHGVGMENIQRCAKKYKGDIDIDIREEGGNRRFCLTVMMYEKSFTPKMP